MKPQKTKSQLGCLGLRQTASTTSFKGLDLTNFRKASVIVAQTVDWNANMGSTGLLPAKTHKEAPHIPQNREIGLAGWKSERKRDHLKQPKLNEDCGSDKCINMDVKGLKGVLKKKLRRDAIKRPNSLDKQLSDQKRSLTPAQQFEGPKAPKATGSFFGTTQAASLVPGSGLFSQRVRCQNESLASNGKQKVIPAQSSPRSHTLSEVPLFQASKSKNGAKVTKSKQMSMQVNQVDSNIEYKRLASAKQDQGVARRSTSIGKKLTASTPPASPHQGPAEGLLTAISPLFKTQLQLHRDHLLGSQLSSCGSMSSPFAETRTRATQGCSYNSGLSKQSPEQPTNMQTDLFSKRCVWHPSKLARFYTFIDPEANLSELHSAGLSAPVESTKQGAEASSLSVAGAQTSSAIFKSHALGASDPEEPAVTGCTSVCSLCAVRLAQQGFRLEELPVEQEHQEEQQQVLYEFHERARLLTDLASFVEKSLKAKLGLVQLHYKQQFQVLMGSASEIDQLYTKMQSHLRQLNEQLQEESQQETQRLLGARQAMRIHKAELIKFGRLLEREHQEGLESDWEATQKQLVQYNETLLQIGEECKRAFGCRSEVSSLLRCEITLGNIEAKFQDVLRVKRKELQPKREEQSAGDTFMTTLERLDALGKATNNRLALRRSAERPLFAAGGLDGRAINSPEHESEHLDIKPQESDEKDLACLSFEGAVAITDKVDLSPNKEYGEFLRKIDDNQSLNLHYYSSLMYDHSSAPHTDIQTPELGGAKDQIPPYLQTHLHTILSQTHPHMMLREAKPTADLATAPPALYTASSISQGGDKFLLLNNFESTGSATRDQQHSSAPERVATPKPKVLPNPVIALPAPAATEPSGQAGKGLAPATT